jgi:uncharacterized protein
MPVRSLASPVLKWPSREAVLAAAQDWANALRASHPRIERVGCFGSYARGDAGVGSDLDLVVIVKEGAGQALFDVTRLPVPADVVVIETARWERLAAEPTGLARTIAREARWF